MKLSQLRHFKAVCEFNSVTHAAAAIGISQPSVSNSIKELENEFEVSLFHRVNKRMVLTPEGDFLLEKAVIILNQTNSLTEHMHNIGNQSKVIKIGVPPMVGTFLFPDIFDKFRAKNPSVKMEIIEHGSLHVQKLVENDDLDLAIISVDETLNPSLHRLHILNTHLRFCVSSGHHLAGHRQIDFQDLKDEPLILFKKDSFQNMIVTRRLAEKGIVPNVLLASSQLYTIQKFISKGNCGAFLFREVSDLEPDIVSIPLAAPFIIDISLIWKKNRFLYSDAAKFIEFTKTYRWEGN